MGGAADGGGRKRVMAAVPVGADRKEDAWRNREVMRQEGLGGVGGGEEQGGESGG